MGVLNLTPDSFSDGGKFIDLPAIKGHIEGMIEQGADLVDLGAESSRPGARAVSREEELGRLKPAFELLRSSFSRAPVEFSIDSQKISVIEQALNSGCTYVNNIGGVFEASFMKELGSMKDIKYIAMHMHKTPENMQDSPIGAGELKQEIQSFLTKSSADLQSAGFSSERYFLDPGLGFGKTDGANLNILRGLARWAPEHPLAIGLSRKSFLERQFGARDFAERDRLSKALEYLIAITGCAKIIRTHDVGGLRTIMDQVFEKDN